MKLLLDTHTFLWSVIASFGPGLPQATRELLEDPTNTLYLSTASVWETAIKISTGKLRLPQPVGQIVNMEITRGDVQLLNIQLNHLVLIETLPFHHKDPFDRLLIAQAQAENLTVVSIDTAFDPYGVNRLWLT
jgi:PIN domain nuclease of toxin-antitoxin system